MMTAQVTPTPAAADRAVPQAQAWRIALSGRGSPLAVISEPRAVVAVANPIDLADAMAMTASPQDDLLLVIWVPPNDAPPADLDGALQAWIRAELPPNRSPV
jgi:hypothetical protein